MPLTLPDQQGVAERFWFDASAVPLPEPCMGNLPALVCLDLFAGGGAVVQAFEAAGHAARAFDMATDPACDITREAGFRLALSLVSSLQKGGLLVAGPPCSLWVYMSSSVHRRSKHAPEGDVANAKVRLANLVVRNVTVLLRLCTQRG